MPSLDARLRARRLGATTPKNRALFTEVSLSIGRERVGLIGANGVGKTTLLRLLAGELHPSQGSVERSGPLAYLRQIPEASTGQSIADLLGLTPLFEARRRIEAGETAPALFDSLEGRWDFEDQGRRELAELGLDAFELTDPVEKLSGGQAQTLRLAALLLQPGLEVLLLDEPTNHLDRAQKNRVIDRLASWPEGLLVASHDRALLRRVDRILELSPRGLREYGGGYALYQEQRGRERAAVDRRCDEAERKLKNQRRAAQERREKFERRGSRGRKSRSQGSQPKTVLDARKARSEKSGGRLRREVGQRLEDALAEHQEARAKRDRERRIDPRIRGQEPPAGSVLFEARELLLTYPGGGFQLRADDLSIVGPERIALIGPNGSGKSSLIACLCGALDGRATRLRCPASVAVLDQEASVLDLKVSLIENLRAAAPEAELSSLRWTLGRFGFGDAEVARPCRALSGGERLRGALACILAADEPPALLVLDEPTNNLDLISVERMAAALRGFRGALLVASHDDDFLEELDLTRAWILRDGRVRAAPFDETA